MSSNKNEASTTILDVAPLTSTSSSNTKRTSDDNDTSIKIRALASFISMNMLEPMLAAGIPIEKIISMTSSSSTSSPPEVDAVIPAAPVVSSSNEDGDTSSTTDKNNSEFSTSLHQKEGDRIVAMEDTFDTTGDTATIAVSTTNDPFLVPDPTPGPMEASSSSYPQQEPPPQDSSLLFIPQIPSVISTAFGRPLPVIQEHVPPIRPLAAATVPTTSSSTPLPVVPSMTTTTTTTNDTSDNTNMAEAEPPISLAAGDDTTTTTASIKAVTDEDPYGE